MSWTLLALGPFSQSLVYPSPSLGYAVRTWAHLCAKIVCRACVGILSVLRLRAKVHPLCAQIVCRTCMGTRSVLRLWAKSAPALCSDCVSCVYGYPLCAQAVGKKRTRTVLRLFFRFSATFVLCVTYRKQRPQCHVHEETLPRASHAPSASERRMQLSWRRSSQNYLSAGCRCCP